ncbi:hypothetical protein U1Q18_040266, partial [Sarracenia purpurea var. burkii]
LLPPPICISRRRLSSPPNIAAPRPALSPPPLSAAFDHCAMLHPPSRPLLHPLRTCAPGLRDATGHHSGDAIAPPPPRICTVPPSPTDRGCICFPNPNRPNLD